MMKHLSRKQVGTKGEQAAQRYLIEQGYRILHTNWRVPTGEIDIVAQIAGVLVFVEVRTRRRNSAFGTAPESVDVRKQIQIRRTAEKYLHFHHVADALVRFDVIAIEYDQSGMHIEHIEHAF